ncbi:MAG TPA: sugar ABC transporter substrate-binding protein, partial [Anaerolineae bacterium]|nr:sugar ABC transporter substrate-binding protein [Anaerolineae bacterium]
MLTSSKKLLVLFTVLLLTLAACGGGDSNQPADTGSDTADAGADTANTPAEDNALEGVPEALITDEPLKIAVIRNLPSDDHTKQFLEGARTEGESFGFVVDTFIADNDDAKFQELVAQAITKGYDGLIISHGKQDYSYDMLKP